MTPEFFALLAALLLVVVGMARPLGRFFGWIMDGRPAWGPLARLEDGLLRLCGVRRTEMGWRAYAVALMMFSLLGTLLLYALQRLQGWLPLNPQQLGAISPDSSFNTAISFVTNTNWQDYAGETTMSNLTQMLGLAVQNFLSAASGIAVAFALIRGFARHCVHEIGNFWVDLYRITAYALLPLSLLLAVALVSQGVIQNFSADTPVTLLQATTYTAPKLDAAGKPEKDAAGQAVRQTVTVARQILPMGPVASQEAIKELGTNGGGFFNANSAHPYENPNALSNFLEMTAVLLIPAALVYTFGLAVGDTRQGWALLAAMVLVFAAAVSGLAAAEQQGNPAIAALGVNQAHSVLQSGGNMEGKETRFGIAASALFDAVTTTTSCGAVNAMIDSFTPLGGLVPMALIQLGEVVFGGVGSGLAGMLVFALVAVFVGGLMIGRTPEYVGKKVEAFDMKMVSIAVLLMPALVLLGTALAVVVPAGLAGLENPGAHGFSEIFYAFTSAANNNGSAFAGLSVNTPFYNGWLGVVMLFGRFGVMVPTLALAGSLAAKKRIPAGGGTLPTHGPLFISLLIGVLLLVGALNFFPAWGLGPVVEQLQLWK
ncbi:MAG: potassium-transporting ATPase subunit KdpA [Thiomonas sp. 13-66-29]|jgi:K+-transporting ATPase ATPase A chain|nr:MAG: potassium-transporting ATPase subunit KdpA [Thiomonas sp. 13-66-29]